MELKALNKNYCLADMLEAEGISDAEIKFIKTKTKGSVIAVAGNIDLCFCQKSIYDDATTLTQKDRRNLKLLEGENHWVAIKPQSRGELR